MSKTCSKCGENKLKTEFYKKACRLDGLQPWCKVCARAAVAKLYAANPEKKKAANIKWHSENADKVKARKAKCYAANPDKAKACHAKYRAENPGKVKARLAKYNAENPEVIRIIKQNRRARQREAGGKLSKGLPEKLFKLQRGKCACCGKPLGTDYHLDHRMPLALGGSNTDDNMQLLTAVCNMRKGAKHPVDFMQQRGFLL